MSIEIQTARRTAIAILSLAAVYLIAGKFGLSLAIEHPSASAIWPPSGIALAALVLWGYRIWPGVFLGAFLVNITTEGDFATTLGIASGNTLGALSGAWLINHFANGHKVFERAKNIFKFVFLAAFLSTAVSATFGVTSLALRGYAPLDRSAGIWFTWWLGDLTGDLLIVPLLVIWLTQPYPDLKPRRILEAAGLLLSVVSLGYIVFLSGAVRGLEYVLILPLLWAAFRFGQRGAITAAFLTSSIALLGTVHGFGPFATGSPNQSLLNLQGFMGTTAMAFLMLASVISEQMRAEQRLEIQQAVSRILADSPDLKDAGSKILQVLCKRAKWTTGAIWNVEQTANELACVEFWHGASAEAPLFEADSRQRRFPPGIGLPGRVLNNGDAAWIPDVTKDSNFPRAPVAAQDGLRAAFGFPIKVAHEVVGVIECFSREVREIDDDFLRIVGDIGSQLGRFMERKRAEEALLESEKELADFFASAAESLHWVGRDGTILRANLAELKMLGYTEAEYVGRNIAEFHVDPKVIEEVLKRLAQGEILKDFSARMRCKDGSILDVLINSSVYWKNGLFTHTRCFTRDITSLKRAEEARAMLAAIVESSDDAIISKNLDGMITSWNTAAERLFGYRPEEIIGQSILRLIPSERHDEETTILSRVRRGEPVDHYETVRVSRDGRRIDVSLTVSPLRNSAGIIVGASKIARDITERKRAEALLGRAKNELIKANEQLERRVQERTADLEEANAALLRNIEEQKRLEEQLRQAQKMESIGTLAGGIAHDFNNTLNIIKAYATLISARYPASQQIVESTKIINEEVDRGAAVVRQLLTLARKTETCLARTDANQVVRRVSELIKETFPKTIGVKLNLERTLYPVLADSNQVNQALLNICLNARDAMPTGGELTLATEMIDQNSLQARYPEASATAHVCIAVTDTGTGMEESVRSRVFEPFFTTKEFGEGTGLGLAMVYGIVKNHHGIVDFESEPGLGTTFLLYLPVFQGDARSVSDEITEGKLPVPSLAKQSTVLVVEDEPAMVHLLKNGLLHEGYRVLVAMDGAEAIDLYQRHGREIDIVLMDLGLPKVTGSDVIRTIKKLNHGVNIIVTTGYIEPELKSELFGAGIKEYIQKPYSVTEVLRRITDNLKTAEF
jgi:PAS domain S-box-containing protein